MSKIIVLFTVLVFLVGCGGGGNSTDDNTTSIDINSSEVEEARILAEEEARIKEEEEAKQKFSPKYYGKWLRTDVQYEKNIISTTMIKNHVIENDNLIRVDRDDSYYYLMRAGLSDIVVDGKVDNIENTNTLNKSPSRIGGINIVLKNVLDSNIKAELKTDLNNKFETSLPIGEYILTIDDNNSSKIEKNISIKQPIENLGTYKLTGDDIHNFKAELILNDNFLYADGLVHEGKIRIYNISKKIGYGLYYNLNLDDSDLKLFTNELTKGSIAPKGYKDIPIKLSFNPILENVKTITIDVKINDVENNEWFDSFNFNIYKGYFNISISTEKSSVKGYIIMPHTHIVKYIKISRKKTITLPLLLDGVYHLLLSNPSFSNETSYSIAINKETDDFKTFNYTPAHEPNNDESSAKFLEFNQSIVSYLHVNDVDYWKIPIVQNDDIFDFSLEKFDELIAENITEEFTFVTKEMLRDNETDDIWQTTKRQSAWRFAMDYCSKLTLGGYKNWSLPTKVQLETLKKINLLMDKHSGTIRYWSSTTHKKYTDEAWFLAEDGFMGYYTKKESYYNYAKCVRAGE